MKSELVLRSLPSASCISEGMSWLNLAGIQHVVLYSQRTAFSFATNEGSIGVSCRAFLTLPCSLSPHMLLDNVVSRSCVKHTWLLSHLNHAVAHVY